MTITRKRLAELDLYGNESLEVIHLDNLVSLKTLNLGMNSLKELTFDNPMQGLENLDLGDNRLTWVDLNPLPKLKTLILDRNAIMGVQGLTTHRHLETLSWRDQHRGNANHSLDYQSCHEIRNLYLSNTNISTFEAHMPFSNLNTLELASMGFQELPADFGLKCRSLRVLNLNYNAIHDIRPLLGIARLRNLFLAGNRVSRLRRTAAVLDRLSTELTELDLRNNTLTVGFYTPQSSIRTGSSAVHAPSNENRLVVINDTSAASNDAPRASSSSSSSIANDDDDDLNNDTIKAAKPLSMMKPYLLPNTFESTSDTHSRAKLDEDTKLRRRVYEMLIISACPSLQRLDGLMMDRCAVSRKDGVWERLMELGVLKAKCGVAAKS